MAGDVFSQYIHDINGAYLRVDATEHTHQARLKTLEQNEKILYTAKEPTEEFQQRQVSSNRT
jgi:hypothetical protein